MPPQNQPISNQVPEVPKGTEFLNSNEAPKTSGEVPNPNPEVASVAVIPETQSQGVQAVNRVEAKTPVGAEPPAVIEPLETTPAGLPVSEDAEAASDIPVIDKEWVQAADGLKEQSQDDPFKLEEGVEDLQIKYLKTRFGKDLKKSA